MPERSRNARFKLRHYPLLSDIEAHMDRPRLAKATAASGEVEGLLMASVLMTSTLESKSDMALVNTWLEKSSDSIDKPWQAQLFLDACSGDSTASATLCEKVAHRLRQLDPDNAVAWLSDLPWRLGQGDRNCYMQPACRALIARKIKSSPQPSRMEGLIEIRSGWTLMPSRWTLPTAGHPSCSPTAPTAGDQECNAPNR